ncbi:MAG: methylated-DNA--[protein]-cysteine S-methyltransferase [Erysipelotrichaceae bacterium]
MKTSVKFLNTYIVITGTKDEIQTAEIDLAYYNDELEGEMLKARQQLIDYTQHALVKFDLNLKPKGTDFQQAVWQALSQIPYGETRTYQEIARLINRPKAVRAVGQACKRNPIGLIVPCHRVVGIKGLTGYYGGLELKAQILKFEKER